MSKAGSVQRGPTAAGEKSKLNSSLEINHTRYGLRLLCSDFFQGQGGTRKAINRRGR